MAAPGAEPTPITPVPDDTPPPATTYPDPETVIPQGENIPQEN